MWFLFSKAKPKTAGGGVEVIGENWRRCKGAAAERRSCSNSLTYVPLIQWVGAVSLAPRGPWNPWNRWSMTRGVSFRLRDSRQELLLHVPEMWSLFRHRPPPVLWLPAQSTLPEPIHSARTNHLAPNQSILPEPIHSPQSIPARSNPFCQNPPSLPAPSTLPEPIWEGGNLGGDSRGGNSLGGSSPGGNGPGSNSPGSDSLEAAIGEAVVWGGNNLGGSSPGRDSLDAAIWEAIAREAIVCSGKR